MEFSFPLFCLYFIVYKSQSGEVELELELGIKSSFLQRIEHLESTGNIVLRKDYVEEEPDPSSVNTVSVVSAAKQALAAMSPQPNRKKHGLKLVSK